MKKLPEVILSGWKSMKGPAIITTVDARGVTNSIYATCISILNNEKILVANNFFNKTLANIKEGCKGNILFLTEDDKAYQLKGTFSHETSGDAFDDMKKWNPETLPGVGVAILDVDEIFSGATKIEA